MITNENETMRKKLLDEAYSKLSARQREVLLYYFYEDLSYKEISELMDFSKSEHARKLVHRAVCKLREELNKKKVFSMIGLPILALVITIFCY